MSRQVQDHSSLKISGETPTQLQYTDIALPFIFRLSFIASNSCAQSNNQTLEVRKRLFPSSNLSKLGTPLLKQTKSENEVTFLYFFSEKKRNGMKRYRFLMIYNYQWVDINLLWTKVRPICAALQRQRKFKTAHFSLNPNQSTFYHRLLLVSSQC